MELKQLCEKTLEIFEIDDISEFVFKCNNKDILPEILIQFLAVWKNQIALLNTMQNQYLTELRDAMLPDLMSGKLQVGSETQC